MDRNNFNYNISPEMVKIIQQTANLSRMISPITLEIAQQVAFLPKIVSPAVFEMARKIQEISQAISPAVFEFARIACEISQIISPALLESAIRIQEFKNDISHYLIQTSEAFSKMNLELQPVLQFLVTNHAIWSNIEISSLKLHELVETYPLDEYFNVNDEKWNLRNRKRWKLKKLLKK